MSETIPVESANPWSSTAETPVAAEHEHEHASAPAYTDPPMISTEAAHEHEAEGDDEGSFTGPHTVDERSSHPAEVAPAPPVLDQSTRPSLAVAPSVSQVSHITEPPSTPEHDLPNVQPATSTPPAAVHADEIDPQVASLQAMFPTFDVSILQLVLEECRGDPDRAVDTLLGMSDPSYKPQTLPPSPQPQLTQEQLDEQLAHRLHMEEQEAVHTRQQPQDQRTGLQALQYGENAAPYRNQQQQQQPCPSSPPGTNIGVAEITQTFKSLWSGASAKVAATGIGRGSGANSNSNPNAIATPNNTGGELGNGGPPGQQGDLRHQFNEIAETGRKGFNSFLTKAKAKMQEYNNPNPQENDPNRTSNNNSPSYSSQPQSSSYYTPTVPPQAGYHVGAQQQFSNAQTYEPNPARKSMSPGRPAQNNLGAPSLPTRSSFDSPAGGDAPRASFDTSRLGLKPKKPVSLINPSAPLQAPPSPTNSKGKNKATEDDIEYITSPFEERD